MSLNSFANLYEEATIDIARHMIQQILDNHLPPLQPEMTVLDLACGTGSATRIIYEHCEAQALQPPKIVGVDIGANFIEAFNDKKANRAWHTAEAFIGDASNLEMFLDSTFDIIIMSFGLFAVKDAVADKVAAETHRVLKPRGHAVFMTWRETWVERMFTGASAAVGRPEEEIRQFRIGKWLKMETARHVLLAGGFEMGKVLHSRLDYNLSFDKLQHILDRFDTLFWRGLGTRNWTEDQKLRWRNEIAKLITDEEKLRS